MSRNRVPIVLFKKFLIPSSLALGLNESQPICDADGKRVMRPSDLPIYGDECYVCDGKPCDDPCALESQIGHLRKELWVWVDKYNGYRAKVIEVCATGKVHAELTAKPSRTLYLEADGSPKEPRSAGKDSEPVRITDDAKRAKDKKKSKAVTEEANPYPEEPGDEEDENMAPCGPDICKCGCGHCDKTS